MIIDSHTHISKIHNSKFEKSFEANLDFMLSEMEGSAIDKVLIIAGPGLEDDFNPTTKTLIRLTAGNPKFSVIGSLDVLEYRKKELLDLERWMKGKLIVGVKLYTGYQHFYPNDERCLPIYRLCIKYNLPIIFHSGDTLAGVVKNPKLKYSHPLHTDEVAADFPELKIVIAHMGNPWLADCAEVMYKNPNVYADISGLVVGQDLETPYGAMMRSRIRDLINYVGDDHKLLYGTDWPLCPMKTYIKFAKGLGLTDSQSEKLFFQNAEKIFGL